jgi:hypothetical protein
MRNDGGPVEEAVQGAALPFSVWRVRSEHKQGISSPQRSLNDLIPHLVSWPSQPELFSFF